jgi:hypothetical protein
VDALARQAEVLRHEGGVVVADREEGVHGSDLPADERERLRAVRLDQVLQEQVLPLQRAADGPAQAAAERAGQADEQRVGQHHDVVGRLRLQEVQELQDLLALEAVLALQHRDRQLAQHLRVDRDGAAGQGANDRGRVPDPVEHPRGLPEERHVLLQVHADAAEEHAVVADVGLVGDGGRVDRQQRYVVPAGDHLRGQRVVAEAAPAVHLAGAGGDGQDPHDRLA